MDSDKEDCDTCEICGVKVAPGWRQFHAESAPHKQRQEELGLNDTYTDFVDRYSGDHTDFATD